MRAVESLSASDVALLQSKPGSLHRKVSGEGYGLKR